MTATADHTLDSHPCEQDDQDWHGDERHHAEPGGENDRRGGEHRPDQDVDQQGALLRPRQGC